ncbi:biotin carboxylase N-terminal domain-containing protein [Pseudarthrobacter sp. C4D7]|uniref:acetyl/propionyl/methylcrotonyl-CoA carboxylase subunit alpha n=1 Tax=Pseudarthrobacter sp. C4D7 TaxID=2735268 RepID=UPI0015851E78|nr:biotin carboxylase N-terminal domain-containing protein [Pseudarthrobacter sp. C4D7]NUT71727.1 ATP-grasp domain-containing protein [Pseudarthrobacter sp. C4D7]
MTTQTNTATPGDSAMTRSGSLFNTVLVANRGEIACRVIRTLRLLGIRSVAVYSDADAGARHVREADTSVRIGPAAASESYLSIDAILDACRLSGAEAVHPGYGFLSENADFARALEKAGIAFIGPGVEALDVMGDKIRAKNHVAGYGVPVVPGIARPGMTDSELVEAAAAVGYPLLIKPSAGGGGKGMHVVEGPADLPAALATARRVAAAAFGDDTLFLERLVTTPRHIEVQVLADSHGNVIHLGERECSLQRRHQKVIEEAPSPLLEGLPNGAEVRARIGEAACNAARSVDYTGAGTVEFLVSDDAPDEFFFMEMNTRLQVEHPVTEMVTGVDLVEWQVRIAAGDPLTVRQADVGLAGHAVEARVYAEVPEKNFLPSTGTVLRLDELPAVSGSPVRVDSSLVEGLELSANYDPMISKVIAWGADRAAALDSLDTTLSGYTALGIETNVEYLRLLLSDPDVQRGHLDTGLIERKLPGLEFRHVGDPELVAAALYALSLEETNRPTAAVGPWQARSGWRLGAPAPRRISLGTADGGVATVAVTDCPAGGGPAVVSVNGGARQEASLRVAEDGSAVLTLAGEERTYMVAAESGPTARLYLGSGGWSCRLELLTREARLERVLAAVQRQEGAADPEVRSPMPGTVVAVPVNDGDAVEAGEVLVSVEAMKMEHHLVAPLAGTVHLTARTGDLVKADQVLATIHPHPTGAVPAPTGTGPETTDPETDAAADQGEGA